MGRIGHEMYTGSGTRDWALKRFRAGRLTEFASVIGDPGGTCLSVGCGTGVFKREYLADAFERIYAIDPARGKLEAANGGEVTALQASAPPLPFETASFDCIVAAGAVEHLPDERGFSTRCRGYCGRPANSTSPFPSRWASADFSVTWGGATPTQRFPSSPTGRGGTSTTVRRNCSSGSRGTDTTAVTATTTTRISSKTSGTGFRRSGSAAGRSGRRGYRT